MATTSQSPSQPEKERVPAIDIASKYFKSFLRGYIAIYNGLGNIESSIDSTFSKYVKSPVNNLFGRQSTSQEEESEPVYEEKMGSSATSSSEKTITARNELVKPGKEITIGLWLLGIAALIYLMISLGAYTRLVKLGHSATGMHPMGWKGQVQHLKKYIDHYIWRKQTGYFHLVVLDEYFSTVLERTIGVLFLAPLGYFMLKGFIMPKLRNRLLGLIVLQILQGIMGSWMLGLEHKSKTSIQDRNLVSPYRMFVHWNTTMFMFAVLLWNALTLLRNPKPVTQENVRENRSLRKIMMFVFGINVLNFITGVTVAGIDGSRDFNTFPLMDGRFIPSGYLSSSSIWKDLFENVATVQFHHRFVAYSTYIAAAVMWIISRRKNITSEAKGSFTIIFLLVNLQIVNGIIALYAKGHWIVGFLHQSNAIWVLGASMFALHALSKPNPAQSENDSQPRTFKHAKTE